MGGICRRLGVLTDEFYIELTGAIFTFRVEKSLDLQLPRSVYSAEEHVVSGTCPMGVAEPRRAFTQCLTENLN